jgi:hypothetical protein
MRSGGDTEVVVIGVLSEEPKRHLNKALRGLETEKLVSSPDEGPGS